MRDGILIGPKQLLNPKAATAQIEMDKALGKNTDFQANCWSRLLDTLTQITDEDKLKPALTIMSKLIHDSLYSRGLPSRKLDISRALHVVAPRMSVEELFSFVTELNWVAEHTYLTADQCLAVAKHECDKSDRGWFDSLALRSVNIFGAPEALLEIATHETYDYSPFTGQCISLAIAAEGAGEDQSGPRGLFWGAVRLLFNAHFNGDRGTPITVTDMASFANRYSGCVQVQIRDGAFTITLAENAKEKAK